MALEWECSECGYVEEGSRAPLRCPECGASRAHFQRIDMMEEDDDEDLDLVDLDDEEDEDEDLDWEDEDEDLFDDDEDF